MDDPIQRHPTRAEQLDILADLVADLAGPHGRILDLGCGTGYFAHILSAKRIGVQIVGVDLKGESLSAAAERFPHHTWIEGDLRHPDVLHGTGADFPVVVTGLTFHDLTDQQKQTLVAWVAGHLAPGGTFLLFDRVRLTDAALFPHQQILWQRQERVYGRGMRQTDDFAAYEADLSPTNAVASLEAYKAMFENAGLRWGVLHQHGNIAIQAGVRSE